MSNHSSCLQSSYPEAPHIYSLMLFSTAQLGKVSPFTEVGVDTQPLHHGGRIGTQASGSKAHAAPFSSTQAPANKPRALIGSWSCSEDNLQHVLIMCYSLAAWLEEAPKRLL